MGLVDIERLELFLENKDKEFLIAYAKNKAGLTIEPTAKIPDIKKAIITHFANLNKVKVENVEDPIPDRVSFYVNTETGFVFNATEAMRNNPVLRPCDKDGKYK